MTQAIRTDTSPLEGEALSRIKYVDTFEYVQIACNQPAGSPIARVCSGWGFNDDNQIFHGPYATHQLAVNAYVRYRNFVSSRSTRKDTP
jgi:hypothetical protein